VGLDIPVDQEGGPLRRIRLARRALGEMRGLNSGGDSWTLVLTAGIEPRVASSRSLREWNACERGDGTRNMAMICAMVDMASGLADRRQYRCRTMQAQVGTVAQTTTCRRVNQSVTNLSTVSMAWHYLNAAVVTASKSSTNIRQTSSHQIHAKTITWQHSVSQEVVVCSVNATHTQMTSDLLL